MKMPLLSSKRIFRRSLSLHIQGMASIGALMLVYSPAFAQSNTPMLSYSTYGIPGIIDMPGAHNMPDGELALTVSHFKNQTRTTLTFQITQRLSGSFRYSNLYDIHFSDPENPLGYVYDRSFSLQYQLLDEARYRPAIAVGLNDFLGTGIYRSEYVTASKTLGETVRVTGGIGWGRLAGVGGFRNPLGLFGERFETRGSRDANQGGQVEIDQWFRGDAALFGGIEWQATPKLKLAAEYSSDAYPNEDPTAFDRKSPFNFAATYRLGRKTDVTLSYLYGSEIGVQISTALNPKAPRAGSGLETAPPAVVVRDLSALGWADPAPDGGQQATRVRSGLADIGIGLHALEIEAATARVEIENETFGTDAQAIGRSARALTGLLPPDIDTFVLSVVRNGLRLSDVTVRRTDLEDLEFQLDNSWTSYSRADIGPGLASTEPLEGLYPRFTFGLDPYLQPALFDPDSPVRADFGIELNARYEPAPGLVLSGAIRQKLVGNLDESTRPSTSILPRVRSDSNIYDREGSTALTELTASYFFRPGENLYGRVSAGYLEPMFGGLSAELLWKPVDSRVAVGAEINYVKQRDFDQAFGFRDYEVATGHVSGYWDAGNGFHVQVDAGRYLAGDWGATLSIDREFRNGWRIGTFATLTDVPFDDFGEGSFDKGFRFTIPIDWITGRPTPETVETTLRPVLRDGGARLDDSDRLYPAVRKAHQPQLRDQWGRFWR